MPRRLTILGSTGSIGRSALDVARHLADEVTVVGLAARGSVARLAEQVRVVRPEAVGVGPPEGGRELRAFAPGWHGEVLVGVHGLADLAAGTTADLVLVCVDGAAGLPPTLAALTAGKDV